MASSTITHIPIKVGYSGLRKVIGILSNVAGESESKYIKNINTWDDNPDVGKSATVPLSASMMDPCHRLTHLFC